MKRSLAILLIFTLCLSFAACGKNNNDNAFSESKAAYEKINEAYAMVNEFSQDIYTAWNMGINDRDDIDGKSSSSYYTSYNDAEELANLARKLNIPVDDLKDAAAYLLGVDEYDPGSSSKMGTWYMLHSIGYSSSFFSACVDLVSTAYELNGKAEQITALLEEAKACMKQLSDKYSDYEHYPSLKKYFTNTTAFFGFCLEPEGSFNQVVDTFNNYRNNARDYFYDLNYVFEDTLFPTDPVEESTAPTEASEDVANA